MQRTMFVMCGIQDKKLSMKKFEICFLIKLGGTLLEELVEIVFQTIYWIIIDLNLSIYKY
jgi:hypothetical protein